MKTQRGMIDKFFPDFSQILFGDFLFGPGRFLFFTIRQVDLQIHKRKLESNS